MQCAQKVLENSDVAGVGSFLYGEVGKAPGKCCLPKNTHEEGKSVEAKGVRERVAGRL